MQQSSVQKNWTYKIHAEDIKINQGVLASDPHLTGRLSCQGQCDMSHIQHIRAKASTTCFPERVSKKSTID